MTTLSEFPVTLPEARCAPSRRHARPPFRVTIPIYEGVDLLDVAVPVELFTWMAESWEERVATVTLAAESLAPIKTRDGLVLTPQHSVAEYAAMHRQSQLLWVPGGNPPVLPGMMKGSPYLDFLKEQAICAEYVSSVCEGALLLAAAGLLDGYEVTTHWRFVPCLQHFPEIKVSEGSPRYVIDRDRITGGGISSGLDEALAIIALVAGDEIAKDVQMTTQYFPCPPFRQDITPATDCPIRF